MAQFEGTVDEFTKYIGAYARIKVMQIASKYKKSLGKCQQCGLETKQLDAAHLKGRERPLIIADILAQFIADDVVRIDLNEFEERFVDAHLPIESTIRILCKSCHREYDRSKKADKIDVGLGETQKMLQTSSPEMSESEIIQKHIKQTKMNKAKAIDLARAKSLTTLNNSNTIFSNINAGRDVWWLEPDNGKFASSLNIILNNDRNQTLYFFKLPADTIKNAAQHFIQRNDEIKASCSKIYIPVSGITFRDERGFDFTKYLVEKIEY